ncbi:MAG: 3-isopropylmalate dehydratase small subunit [SAR324 cluster bacterium]|nr:3-isopropylmalate dehydratase small subunit [SAR324 cluster bacterium]
MEAYKTFTGNVALINKDNIDTDQIIPKLFLKKVERTGFGVHLFQDWRYLDNGEENPEFELNQPQAKGASILVAGDNFGCGSSREHAPWALEDFGFKAIIAVSFADIFYNNCFKNGILPIKVSAEVQTALAAEITAAGSIEFTVDLENQKFTTAAGQECSFAVDPFRKETLLKGLDDIGWTLEHEDKISSFEDTQKNSQPWLWQ